MKKSIVYLGMALLSFSSFASNPKDLVNTKSIVVTVYDSISPLNIAIFKGDAESVKKFIGYGADVNQKSNGMSPLMFAARYNHIAILQILLSNGANPKVKDEKGFTALKHAQISGAKEAALILKQI